MTVASIALATVSWYALERPINDLKRFFPYTTRRPKSRRATIEASGPGLAPVTRP